MGHAGERSGGGLIEWRPECARGQRRDPGHTGRAVRIPGVHLDFLLSRGCPRASRRRHPGVFRHEGLDEHRSRRFRGASGHENRSGERHSRVHRASGGRARAFERATRALDPALQDGGLVAGAVRSARAQFSGLCQISRTAHRRDRAGAPGHYHVPSRQYLAAHRKENPMESGDRGDSRRRRGLEVAGTAVSQALGRGIAEFPSMTRRELLIGAAAAATPVFAVPRTGMGIATTSLMTARRMHDTYDFLEYCYTLGAGGIQASLASLDAAYLKKLRARAGELGMYIEVMIELPKEDATAFERGVQAAKDAGAVCLRTGCLG